MQCSYSGGHVGGWKDCLSTVQTLCSCTWPVCILPSCVIHSPMASIRLPFLLLCHFLCPHLFYSFRSVPRLACSPLPPCFTPQAHLCAESSPNSIRPFKPDQAAAKQKKRKRLLANEYGFVSNRHTKRVHLQLFIFLLLSFFPSPFQPSLRFPRVRRELRSSRPTLSVPRSLCFLPRRRRGRIDFWIRLRY